MVVTCHRIVSDDMLSCRLVVMHVTPVRNDGTYESLREFWQVACREVSTPVGGSSPPVPGEGECFDFVLIVAKIILGNHRSFQIQLVTHRYFRPCSRLT